MSSRMGHPLAYPVIVTIGALAICLAWAPFGDSEQVAMLGAVAVCVLGYSGFRLGTALGYLPAGLPRSAGAGVNTAARAANSASGEQDSDRSSRDSASGGTDHVEPERATAVGTPGSDDAGAGLVRTETAARELDSAGAGRAAGGALVVRRVRQQHRLVSRSWLEITGGGRTWWLPVYFAPALLTVTRGRGEISGRALYVDGQRVYPAGRVRDDEPVGKLIDNPTRPAPDAAQLADRATGPGRRLLLDAQSAIAAPFAGLLWIYVAGGTVSAFAAATVVAGATATWLAAIRGSDPS
ncbi:hypothetical protein ACWIGI_03315 [Nocardia sp. NPDC055321]